MRQNGNRLYSAEHQDALRRRVGQLPGQPADITRRLSMIQPGYLIALAAILVPIILHLLNRRSAKLIEWGAMQFLLGSLISRRRRILLEEMMLLAIRCLLFAMVVLV